MAEADMVDLISCLGSKESRMFDSGMMVEKKNVISKPLRSAFHVFLSVRSAFDAEENGDKALRL